MAFDFAAFFGTHKWTILFYVVLILLIYLFRKKFEWHGIIGLYRTKVGLRLMDRLGKGSTFFRWFGYTAIWVGFAGMLFIVGIFIKGLYDLAFVPNAPPVVSPVLPGVPVLGLGITVPLIIGWIALFFVIVIHEFSHGVVARAHDVKVKSSGLMLFGPLGGAFVEPEEKVLEKRGRTAQLSVFAAGPFSNIVSAALVLLLLTFAFAPLLSGFVARDGVVFDSVQDGFPAALAGVEPGVIYSSVNGAQVNTGPEFVAALEGVKPGDEVVLGSEDGELVSIVAAAHPQNETRGYLGVVQGVNLKDPGQRWLYIVVEWVFELFTWIFLLSLGIGLANLLPLGPVDGGRMFQVVTEKLFGKKAGDAVWSKVTFVVIAILLILLLVPIGRAIFGF